MQKGVVGGSSREESKWEWWERRGKNLITQRSTSKQVLYGENVENLCMWKVASEKKPFLLIFCAMVFARVFSSHLQETTTTTRTAEIFSVLGVIQKRKISAVVCCKNREQAYTSSAHTFSCYNVYEEWWGEERLCMRVVFGGSRNRWCKYKEFMQL